MKVDVTSDINNIVKPRDFEFLLCERKNGSKFIKVVMYFNDANGYIEVARINSIKNNFSEDGFGDLLHLFDDLKSKDYIVSDIRHKLLNNE